MKVQSSHSASPDQNTGKGLKIAIVLARFNDSIGNKLYEKTYQELLRLGIQEKNIKLFRVPGALETPFAAQKIAEKKQYDALIALGVIIKGETTHFEHVSRETWSGLMKIQLEQKIPIINGILTTNTIEQAKDRIKNGTYYAQSALEMTQAIQ